MLKIMNFDLATAAGSRAVIVVEGMSDRVALETLAERRGMALGAQGSSIVHLDGATNIGHFLDLFGPRGLDVRLAGLCDAAEEAYFRRALERAGVGSPLSRADMEALGFYVCGADLEEELIRALGVAGSSGSSRRRVRSGHSASSKGCPRGRGRAPRGNCTGSWGPGPAGRACTRG